MNREQVAANSQYAALPDSGDMSKLQEQYFAFIADIGLTHRDIH